MTFLPGDLLDLAETDHAALFPPGEPVWAALPLLEAYLWKRLDRTDPSGWEGEVDPRAQVGDAVFVAQGAVIEANAVVRGPAWIGRGTVVRSGAYLRENVIVGDDCILGNSSEFKNCLLFNGCEVPHFNYVGDSILGHRAHLGAGVVCSNVRLDRGEVKVREVGGASLATGLRKFGAVVGDRTEVGCNSVLSPGSILGRDCLVHPLTSWRGVLPDRHVARSSGDLQVLERP